MIDARLSVVRGGGGWELADASTEFLRALPTSLRFEVEGVRIAVHHGSPTGDMDGIDPAETETDRARTLLREADADVLLVGHTHVSFAIEVDRGGLIANPVALLRSPADGPGGPPAPGTFGVLAVGSGRFGVFRANDGQPEEPALSLCGLAKLISSGFEEGS